MNDATTDLNFTPSSVRIKELERLGEGRQAELFVFAGCVVKLFRDAPNNVAAARREAATMSMVQVTGIPMPRVLGTVTIEDRPGIVMERLTGTDQLSLLGRKPWFVWNAAKNLARLHAQLHSKLAPHELPSLKASLREEIERSDSVPPEHKQIVAAALDSLPDGAAICHWDLHPGNVIETREGPRIIDWAIVRRGDAPADVARTLLIIHAGALPPGAPLLVRALVALGRRLLSGRYLREYRRVRPLDDAGLGTWNIAAVASRLSHGIPEEREYLLERLKVESRRWRKSVARPS